MAKHDLNDFRLDLISRFGQERVKVNEPLARHCNWRIGGPADLFLTVRSVEELIEAVRIAHKHDERPTILGFGANVLVSDSGIRGLVILNRAQRIAFPGNGIVEADSGSNLAVLAKEAAVNGVGGLEFLVGIPGTVGAAVAVNAGTKSTWVNHVLERAKLLDETGEISWVDADELEFAYRHSRIPESGEIVLTARLQGHTAETADIEKNLKQELQVRKTQPTGPSTGSVFTNPEGDFAGRLIETCGLKGHQIGGARVSEMHANFIINTGGATASDVKSLIALIKKEVEDKHGIALKEEIRYLGEFSS